MKKIEKYVVFKYEDEFGFHYMVIDKLPGEEPTYMEPTPSEKKKINPIGFHYMMMDELPRKEPTHPETLKLEKVIEPIREAYSRLSPSGRSTFIAQMVYLLTK